MNLTRIRDRAMMRGMQLMQDPRFTKVMNDPRAQKMLMQAFQLPSKIEGAFTRQGKAIAKRFKLATREDVDALKATIRDLERTIRDLKQD